MKDLDEFKITEEDCKRILIEGTHYNQIFEDLIDNMIFKYNNLIDTIGSKHEARGIPVQPES